jgi:hypothetical protein
MLCGMVDGGEWRLEGRRGLGLVPGLGILDGGYRGAAEGVFSKMLRRRSMFVALPDLPLAGRLGGIEKHRVWDPFILLRVLLREWRND